MKRTAKEKTGKPYKKVVISAIVGIGILLVLYFVLEGNSNTTFETDELDPTVTLEQLSENDSDGDGLADWEELLAGLNPYDIDTDGDGIDDYQTLTSMRRILAEGDDVVIDGNSMRFVSAENNTGTLTRTDETSRQLYALIEILESTGELTPEKQAELTGILSQDISTPQNYRTYEFLELNLTDELGSGDELVYLQDMLNLLENYQYSSPNPLTTLNESIERDDPTYLEEGLTLMIENQTETLNQLRSIKVFPLYIDQHLEFLNLVERVLVNTRQIQLFHQDPLGNYIGLTEYINHAKAFSEALLDFTQTVDETITYYQSTAS